MSKQLETYREQAQIQNPHTHINIGEPRILQTTLNEERNKKRDRETTTPTSGPLGQPGTKRQRLNPLSEEELSEETTDSQREERVESRQTFPTRGTSTSS